MMEPATNSQVAEKQPFAKRRRRKRWIKRALWALVALAGVALALRALWPKPLAVDVARVQRRPLTVSVDEDGRTRMRDRYTVLAPVNGSIMRIELREGDAIAEGQVVATIMPMESPLLDPRGRATAEARLAAARANQAQVAALLARAKVNDERASRESDDQAKLLARGATSRANADAALFAAHVARNELIAADFAGKVAVQEVNSALAVLGASSGQKREQLRLPAPAAGEVLRVFRRDAGAIAAGEPVLELGHRATIEIVSDVLTQDSTRVVPGARVMIERWGGPDLIGHVHRVEPSAFTRVSSLGVEEQRVHVIIHIESPAEQWKQLGDGFRVHTRIVVWQSGDALVVPSSAVFRDNAEWALFRVSGGIAKRTLVQVGERAGGDTQILSGVAEGDTIIVHPSSRVSDGANVEAR